MRARWELLLPGGDGRPNSLLGLVRHDPRVQDKVRVRSPHSGLARAAASHSSFTGVRVGGAVVLSVVLGAELEENGFHPNIFCAARQLLAWSFD